MGSTQVDPDRSRTQSDDGARASGAAGPATGG